MQTAKQLQLQVRSLQLQARSSALRQRLTQQAQALQEPLAVADQIHSCFNWLVAQRHWAAALGTVAVVVLRPRRAANWFLKLWWGWRSWRRVQGWLKH